MIAAFEDADAFARLREEWDDLLARSDAASPFLTWEWLHTWSTTVGCAVTPLLLVVRDGGRLVGLAPMAIKGWELARLRAFRSLTLLGAPLAAGNVGSDYLDVLVDRARPDVLEVMAQALAARGVLLDLPQVDAGRADAERLARELIRRDWRVRREPCGVCPVADLRGLDWPSFLATLGREHRYAVGRKLRKLQRDFAVGFDRVRDDAERLRAFAVLLDLHARRWAQKGTSDAFHTPALRRFHEELTRLALARGWLRLWTLRLDGAPAAALYGLRYRDTFYFYQSGFDPAYARHGVGVAALALSFQAALEEGVGRYDFLHGEEEYKFHWANARRPLVRYHVFPPRLQGAVARALIGARALAVLVARRMLPDS